MQRSRLRTRLRRGRSGAVTLQPVTLPLPRVRRQPDLAAALAINVLPVNGPSRRVERSQRSEQHGPLVTVASQCRNSFGGIVTTRLETRFDIRRQRGVRRDLEKHAMLAA